MAEYAAVIGAIEINDNRRRTVSLNMNNQECLLRQLQTMHNNYVKGLITDKDKYKKDREQILKQLTASSLSKLIEQTPNIYLKNYYATFLK